MKIIETFEAALRSAIHYPIEVESSSDEETCLCVFVYGVDRPDMAKIRNTISDIEDEILIGTQYVSIPMVKSLAVTQEYYPSKLAKPNSTCETLPRAEGHPVGLREANCGSIN